MHVLILLALVIALPAAAQERSPEVNTEAEALLTQALGSSAAERIPLLTRALQLAPGEARYWVALGDAYTFDSAGEQPPAAEAQPPEPPKALDPAQGRRCYEQATKFAPNSPLPYMRLAILAWENDRASAATHLENAIERDPKNALPLYERALLHFLAGEDARGRERVLAAAECEGLHWPLVMPPGEMNLMQASRCTALLAAQTMPYLSHMRELSRQMVRVAAETPPNAPEQARAILLEGQRLAYRLIAAEPRMVISVLVGIAVDSVVETPLRFFLLGRGDPAALARLDQRKQALSLVRERQKDFVQRLPQEIGTLNPIEAKIQVFHSESEAVAAALKESQLKATSEE